ncbi:MAG: methionine gamma-lyase family protein [Clostridiales bacterium]|jgi:cystathionine beta-lyase family protein involved in aluminum resistance|nr:methionine gamma-lyase family protein [Clostridiales bacterium]
MNAYDYLIDEMGVDARIAALAAEAEAELRPLFACADGVAEYNQLKVLRAMQKNKLSDIHFALTTGYGYHDMGRDTLENIYAELFHAEAALVRPQMISGTHALTVALFGNLRYGDELLSPVGKPYDTLESVIGIRAASGSLREHGVTYRQVDLLPDGAVDYDGVAKAITPRTKLVTIQRSKGYAWRRSFSVAEMGLLIQRIKSIRGDIICMVDNCYGEFVEEREPMEAGADLAVGSLIKNPGGGLAPSGGYIVGKKEYVDRAAARLTVPGLGKEVGPGLGLTLALTQGLFLAPQTVSGALKAAMLAARMFERLGFGTLPAAEGTRSDIVQAIRMGSAEAVLSFCRGIQKAAPVDSFVTPEPWDMPGYDAPVIMAAGAFIQGSSIELSADAPMKEPYIVYFQGGLTWPHAKAGVIMAADTMLKDGALPGFL